MRVVRRYTLEHKKDKDGAQAIRIPRGAAILDVQMQGCEAVMWALVDPSVGREDRRFILIWTGEERTDLHYGLYIGTFQAGPTAWHLFEVLEDMPYQF